MTIDERHNAPGNAEDLFGLLAIERTHIQERWFFLHWVCVAVHEISLVAGRGDYSLVALSRLLTLVVTSLVTEHRL